jgi:hypothetical protein
MDQEEISTFINQYVSMWHEPDPVRRHEIIGALFAEEAENYTRGFAARGSDEIIARVARAHEEWVAVEGFVFRLVWMLDGAGRKHNQGKAFPTTIGTHFR